MPLSAVEIAKTIVGADAPCNAGREADTNRSRPADYALGLLEAWSS